MMTMRRNMPGLAALALALAMVAPRAQVVVTKGAGDTSSIDFAGFSATGANGTLFLQVLQNDLVRSGWFSLARTGGEFSVQGAVRDGARIEVEGVVVQTALQRRVLAKRWHAPAAEVRMLAHQVSDEIVKAVTGKEGFAQSRLALVGNRTGRKELYLCDSDGANLQQLTQDKSISLFPRWSPDNRRLVYTSYVQRYPDLLLIELATGARQKLASFPGLNTGGAFSPDGTQAAMILSRDGNPELYVMTLAGRQLTRLTRTPNAAEASPSWSPDGRRIVFVSDAAGVSRPQLYIVDRGGGAPRRVTSRGPQNVSPDWGPDGRIAFSSFAGGVFSLCVLDPDTLDVTVVAADAASYEEPGWARNGRHIACARSLRQKSSICLVDTVTREKVLLVDGQGDWTSPNWQK